MSLAPGARLGSYEIVALIGAGGMGEVYRARDGKLTRDVALKILPPLFARDPERLARFSREANLLATLNHPNIAAIYGFESSDHSPALVLEMVEGPTLADRIARGPIPLEDALPIARQIAEALEAAHAQGIVHRDLKPANIARHRAKIPVRHACQRVSDEERLCPDSRWSAFPRQSGARYRGCSDQRDSQLGRWHQVSQASSACR